MIPPFISKYLFYIILAVVIAAAVTGYVLLWEASIKREALLQFNNQQLNQTLEEQKKYVKNLQDINANQKKIIDDMNKKNDQLESELKTLEEYLNSAEAKKEDRTASEILKRTIQELSGKRP